MSEVTKMAWDKMIMMRLWISMLLQGLVFSQHIAMIMIVENILAIIHRAASYSICYICDNYKFGTLIHWN